jgi:hypothetical protein
LIGMGEGEKEEEKGKELEALLKIVDIFEVDL